MPRHDPPEGGVTPYYTDPPMEMVNLKEINGVIFVSDEKNTSPARLSHSLEDEMATLPHSPEKQSEQVKSPGRNDDDTPRKEEETTNLRDTEELPDSLMVTYTLSSHSSARPRRSSRVRTPNKGTPNKDTPDYNNKSTNTVQPGSANRVYIENMPATPLAEKSTLEDEGNRGGRPRTTSKTPTSANNKNSSTYLTRKAYKFSSMKKKRTPGSTSMLNRLFCSSEEDLAHATLSLDESDGKNPDSPPKTILVENEKQVEEYESESGCQAIADMMDRAKDTFMLTTEAEVSRSIQAAVTDALDVVQKATTTPKSSKKADSSSNVEKEEEKEKTSLASIFDHWKRKSMGAVSATTDETTPSWKLKAQAARAKTEQIKKASESQSTTPVPLSGARTLFPSAIEYWEAVTSGKQTPAKPPAEENQEKTLEPSNEEEAAQIQDENIDPLQENTELVNSYVREDSESIVSAPSDEPNEKQSSPKKTPKESLSGSVDDDDDAFLPDDFPAKTEAPTSEIESAIAKARVLWEKKELVAMRKKFEEQKVDEIRKKLEVEFAKERDSKIAEIKAAEKAKWEATEKERKKTLVAVEKERQKKLDEIEQEMTKLLEIQKEHLDRHAPKEETERKLRELRLQMQAEKDLEIKAFMLLFQRLDFQILLAFKCKPRRIWKSRR